MVLPQPRVASPLGLAAAAPLHPRLPGRRAGPGQELGARRGAELVPAREYLSTSTRVKKCVNDTI